MNIWQVSKIHVIKIDTSQKCSFIGMNAGRPFVRAKWSVKKTGVPQSEYSQVFVLIILLRFIGLTSCFQLLKGGDWNSKPGKGQITRENARLRTFKWMNQTAFKFVRFGVLLYANMHEVQIRWKSVDSKVAPFKQVPLSNAHNWAIFEFWLMAASNQPIT